MPGARFVNEYTPPIPLVAVMLMFSPKIVWPVSVTVSPTSATSPPLNVPLASASAYTKPEIELPFTVSRSVSCAGSVSRLNTSTPGPAPKSRSLSPSGVPVSTAFGLSPGCESQKMRALFSIVAPENADAVPTTASKSTVTVAPSAS